MFYEYLCFFDNQNLSLHKCKTNSKPLCLLLKLAGGWDLTFKTFSICLLNFSLTKALVKTLPFYTHTLTYTEMYQHWKSVQRISNRHIVF